MPPDGVRSRKIGAALGAATENRIRKQVPAPRAAWSDRATGTPCEPEHHEKSAQQRGRAECRQRDPEAAGVPCENPVDWMLCQHAATSIVHERNLRNAI